MTMARKKTARLVSKAEAARELGLKWWQVDYLVRKFDLPRIQPAGNRHPLYRLTDIKTLVSGARLARAS
jgi:hypothetical protein